MEMNILQIGSDYINETFCNSIGQIYSKEVSIYNSGQSGFYMRFIINKYWVDSDGNKVTTVDPELIHVDFDYGGWIIPESQITEECTIMYYCDIIESGNTLKIPMNITMDESIINLANVYEFEDENGTNIEVSKTFDRIHSCD